jgi:FtsP/CotA-like multicopper oxidase with cupredoxin domain
MHDLSHGGGFGNVITTNAKFDLSRRVSRHQRLWLRLINAPNARIFQLALKGLDRWTVAHDRVTLPQPEKVTTAWSLPRRNGST